VVNKERIHVLARTARSATTARTPVGLAPPSSLLWVAAASYGARPSEDMTIPTGFDPVAAALFETIIEAAYLLANADGVFDDDERRAFERVVVEACGGTVAPLQVAGLVGDLQRQLREEGMDRRIEKLATSVTKREHAQEVLRICALIAETREDVSVVERDVLSKIATRCGLASIDVDAALADAKSALATD
jgi:tellurite resistance protein